MRRRAVCGQQNPEAGAGLCGAFGLNLIFGQLLGGAIQLIERYPAKESVTVLTPVCSGESVRMKRTYTGPHHTKDADQREQESSKTS